MPKKTAKKTKGTAYTLYDTDHALTVNLSIGEVFELANRHIAAAKGMPKYYGKFLNSPEGRKLSGRDLKTFQKLVTERIDWHFKRADQLRAIARGTKTTN